MLKWLFSVDACLANLPYKYGGIGMLDIFRRDIYARRITGHCDGVTARIRYGRFKANLVQGTLNGLQCTERNPDGLR